MSKKKTTKPEAENPEVEQTLPAYAKELLERGVAVVTGRSRGELDEKLAAIPTNINYYTGAVGTYLDTGIVRIQVNLKED